MAEKRAPKIADEAVRKRTGKTWDEWFGLLDAWGAKERPHPEIARHLYKAHRIDPWWAQNVTVEYERARGLRAHGQRASGAYEVSLQRTIPISPAVALSAWTDGGVRATWLKDAKLKARVAKGEPSARTSSTSLGQVLRMEVPAGPAKPAEKLEVTFQPKGSATAVRVVHSGLATAEDRADAKERWGRALDALKGASGRGDRAVPETGSRPAKATVKRTTPAARPRGAKSTPRSGTRTKKN